MRCKIFCKHYMDELEKEINDWLSEIDIGAIIKWDFKFSGNNAVVIFWYSV